MTTKICRASEFDEKRSMGFTINNQALLIVKHNQIYYAYQNKCPHMGIALDFNPGQFLDFEKQFIQCAMHGALFKFETGECVHGPCLGKHLEPIKLDVKEGWIIASV